MNITAGLTHFKTLNEEIKKTSDCKITIDNCLGQRYIASGMSGKRITIHGTPGNALGSYLNDSVLEVFGNAQDATGDTMNEGEIIVHGNCGDATGYGMRGGKIFVQGDCGYRGGIHMKAYQEKLPVLVIGGKAGSFLGEYQAGGLIIVLGKGCGGEVPVSYFCGTGMHGGKIFLRCAAEPSGLPPQVLVQKASAEDMQSIKPFVNQYCTYFGDKAEDFMNDTFYVLSPNPDPEAGYKQLYVYN